MANKRARRAYKMAEGGVIPPNPGAGLVQKAAAAVTNRAGQMDKAEAAALGTGTSGASTVPSVGVVTPSPTTTSIVPGLADQMAAKQAARKAQEAQEEQARAAEMAKPKGLLSKLGFADGGSVPKEGMKGLRGYARGGVVQGGGFVAGNHGALRFNTGGASEPWRPSNGEYEGDDWERVNGSITAPRFHAQTGLTPGWGSATSGLSKEDLFNATQNEQAQRFVRYADGGQIGGAMSFQTGVPGGLRVPDRWNGEGLANGGPVPYNYHTPTEAPSTNHNNPRTELASGAFGMRTVGSRIPYVGGSPAQYGLYADGGRIPEVDDPKRVYTYDTKLDNFGNQVMKSTNTTVAKSPNTLRGYASGGTVSGGAEWSYKNGHIAENIGADATYQASHPQPQPVEPARPWSVMGGYNGGSVRTGVEQPGKPGASFGTGTISAPTGSTVGNSMGPLSLSNNQWNTMVDQTKMNPKTGYPMLADGGGVRSYIHGGKVHGKGGPTEDKQPIMASPGEYMLPADTAAKVGHEKLDELVAKTHKPVHSLRGYADGEEVQDPYAIYKPFQRGVENFFSQFKQTDTPATEPWGKTPMVIPGKLAAAPVVTDNTLLAGNQQGMNDRGLGEAGRGPLSYPEIKPANPGLRQTSFTNADVPAGTPSNSIDQANAHARAQIDAMNKRQGEAGAAESQRLNDMAAKGRLDTARYDLANAGSGSNRILDPGGYQVALTNLTGLTGENQAELARRNALALGKTQAEAHAEAARIGAQANMYGSEAGLRGQMYTADAGARAARAQLEYEMSKYLRGEEVRNRGEEPAWIKQHFTTMMDDGKGGLKEQFDANAANEWSKYVKAQVTPEFLAQHGAQNYNQLDTTAKESIMDAFKRQMAATKQAQGLTSSGNDTPMGLPTGASLREMKLSSGFQTPWSTTQSNIGALRGIGSAMNPINSDLKSNYVVRVQFGPEGKPQEYALDELMANRELADAVIKAMPAEEAARTRRMLNPGLRQ